MQRFRSKSPLLWGPKRVGVRETILIFSPRTALGTTGMRGLRSNVTYFASATAVTTCTKCRCASGVAARGSECRSAQLSKKCLLLKLIHTGTQFKPRP